MSIDMQSVEISQLFSAGFACDLEGVEHRKTLPCLSVVQALHGYYEIGLDHKALVSTGQGGAFIAPANCFQRIIHHNGSEHVMRAHWVSMHVRVNTFYRLEDLYEFPRLFPPEENEALAAHIAAIRYADNICAGYAAAYQILERLLRVSKRRAGPARTMIRVQEYVAAHFREPIRADDLAGYLCCSPAQVYRLFRRYFSLSPANYINRVRLQNAAMLLETSAESVTAIAVASGYDDIAYFSKCFKDVFSVSPSVYRRQNAHARSK